MWGGIMNDVHESTAVFDVNGGRDDRAQQKQQLATPTAVGDIRCHTPGIDVRSSITLRRIECMGQKRSAFGKFWTRRFCGRHFRHPSFFVVWRNRALKISSRGYGILRHLL